MTWNRIHKTLFMITIIQPNLNSRNIYVCSRKNTNFRVSVSLMFFRRNIPTMMITITIIIIIIKIITLYLNTYVHIHEMKIVVGTRVRTKRNISFVR